MGCCVGLESGIISDTWHEWCRAANKEAMTKASLLYNTRTNVSLRRLAAPLAFYITSRLELRTSRRDAEAQREELLAARNTSHPIS